MTGGTVHDDHLYLIGVEAYGLRLHGLTAWNVSALVAEMFEDAFCVVQRSFCRDRRSEHDRA
jgi:hypothetical protein